jgi:hypothetical protein
MLQVKLFELDDRLHRRIARRRLEAMDRCKGKRAAKERRCNVPDNA